MALSSVTRNVFSILPLLVIITITPLSSSFSPTDKVTTELLNQLCAKPPIDNITFCIWQTSSAVTIALDLGGLVDMVLEKTRVFGNMNLSAMKDLATTTTDPYLKDTYKICAIDYELAVTAIEGAQVFARSKSYELVPQAASKALDIISSCEADLKDLKNVSNSIRNLVFERMCNIGSVFSSVLTS
ncbi:invertase/pectin methylesterase inhibitor family protein [Raphanus sativus]|uniref:Uncharacterized protein LOC130495003 n=1 Tax=Raphanus sativus TaxID=3726 RepID=A0A9W3BRE7_RAPSA|nr:uncharacterized protein LOC130495003 [Raphanus sativus]KAJ4897897.1 invertase/pectin methylesterase inhibitor family protein [Raphanus sativus]